MDIYCIDKIITIMVMYVMHLKRWRETQSKNLGECAILMGIGGKNPASVYRRIEIGERPSSAEMTEKICAATGGVVTAQDMHETRLRWLRAHKLPEVISTV